MGAEREWTGLSHPTAFKREEWKSTGGCGSHRDSFKKCERPLQLYAALFCGKVSTQDTKVLRRERWSRKPEAASRRLFSSAHAGPEPLIGRSANLPKKFCITINALRCLGNSKINVDTQEGITELSDF